MSRYRGPRLKKIRRLGTLPGLSTKRDVDIPKHRKITKPRRKASKIYNIRLTEKQKLCLHYGLTERQLLKYVRIAGRAKGETNRVLLQLLEMRLDNILFRLGMATTLPAARQLVTHRHILVNGRIVDIPSYRCKPKETIEVRDDQSRALIQKYLAVRSQEIEELNKIATKKRINKKKRKAAETERDRRSIPNHLAIRRSEYKGLVNQIINPAPVQVGLEINALQVVEYYSRQI